MEYIEELQTKSAPKIKKAAAKIGKQQLHGYGEYLLDALKSIINNPKSWQAQSETIRTLGITNCVEASEYLKELLLFKFDSTVLYHNLGFSICLLEDIPNSKLNFLKSTLSSNNDLLISGACSALLYKKFIPSEQDIEEILEVISSISADEGNVITPRCYIAALAYMWPPHQTKSFLEACLQSKWSGLVEIAQSSINGKQTKYVLV